MKDKKLKHHKVLDFFYQNGKITKKDVKILLNLFKICILAFRSKEIKTHLTTSSKIVDRINGMNKDTYESLNNELTLKWVINCLQVYKFSASDLIDLIFYENCNYNFLNAKTFNLVEFLLAISKDYFAHKKIA